MGHIACPSAASIWDNLHGVSHGGQGHQDDVGAWGNMGPVMFSWVIRDILSERVTSEQRP